MGILECYAPAPLCPARSVKQGCLCSPSRLFEAHAPGWGGGGKGSLVSCKKTDLEKTVERFV